MIDQLQLVQTFYAAGAGAMSGTINNTALSNGKLLDGVHNHVVITDTSHGIKADSQLFFSDIKSGSYNANQMRYVRAVDTNTMTIALAASEAYAAGTPAGSEVWCAGALSPQAYTFVGFKLHLSAADTNGETLTLTIDSKKSAYFDTVIYSKVMTGVTDIIYVPERVIPINGGDVLKFAWTNTGAKTWGVETMIIARG